MMFMRRVMGVLLYLALANSEKFVSSFESRNANLYLRRMQKMEVTWYGEPFHGRKMANGETFNMHDPTIVASRHLPLGTIVLLQYRGRRLLVEVKDRMSAEARPNQLDLSLAAAKELGLVDVGRTRVFGQILS